MPKGAVGKIRKGISVAKPKKMANGGDCYANGGIVTGKTKGAGAGKATPYETKYGKC